jgi:nucleoside-diphosphate-sugar epimerase
VILYNGASGGLGRYLATAAGPLDGSPHALRARLEDSAGIRSELDSLRTDKPITFVHLAAMVSVPACEADPARARSTNVTNAVAALESVIRWALHRGSPLRVIYVSTGHVYDAAPVGSRIGEESKLLPRSVYAQTKVEAEGRFAEISRASGVPLAVCRVFGMLAPVQAPNYVLPGLIDRVRERRVGGVPGLHHVRDYLDARDVARCLAMLGSVPWPESVSVVNVCSGVPMAIRELLAEVARRVDPPNAEALVSEATPAPGRPDDLPWIVGDPGRFVEITGSHPQSTPLNQTVADAVSARVS